MWVILWRKVNCQQKQVKINVSDGRNFASKTSEKNKMDITDLNNFVKKGEAAIVIAKIIISSVSGFAKTRKNWHWLKIN